MANKVGPKGQVVIDKAIRDRLGVQCGWQTVQMVVDDHVELRFIPPWHNRSLRGAAKPFIRRRPAPDEDWDEAVARAATEDYLPGGAEK